MQSLWLKNKSSSGFLVFFGFFFCFFLIIIFMWSWKRGTQPAVTLGAVGLHLPLGTTLQPARSGRSSWTNPAVTQDPPAMGWGWVQDPCGCLVLSWCSQPLGVRLQHRAAVGAVDPQGGRQAALSTPGCKACHQSHLCVLSPQTVTEGKIQRG